MKREREMERDVLAYRYFEKHCNIQTQGVCTRYMGEQERHWLLSKGTHSSVREATYMSSTVHKSVCTGCCAPPAPARGRL